MDYFSYMEDQWEKMNEEYDEEEYVEEEDYKEEKEYDGRYDYPNEWDSIRAIFNPNGNYLNG